MGRRLTALIHDVAREARRRGRHDIAADLSRFAYDGYDPTTDRGLAERLGQMLDEVQQRVERR